MTLDAATTSYDITVEAAARDLLGKARRSLGLPETVAVEDLTLVDLAEMVVTGNRLTKLAAVRIFASDVALGQMLLKAQAEQRQAKLIRSLQDMMGCDSLTAAKEAKRLRECAGSVTVEQLAQLARVLEEPEHGIDRKEEKEIA